MSLGIYSNHFRMLCNHMGMMVLRAFHSCWKFFAFNQIQLDAYCAMVWRRFAITFKLWPMIPIFEWNEMSECPRKPWQPTSIGIIWHIQPFSTQSSCSVSYWFFFRSCASSSFLPSGQSIIWGGHSSLNQTPLQCLVAFLFEWCELEIVEMSWDPLKLSCH